MLLLRGKSNRIVISKVGTMKVPNFIPLLQVIIYENISI